jgi:mannose/cellobiose epimerase-like protein (N-acyl-D-glucosamine 2-epimerase family)
MKTSRKTFIKNIITGTAAIAGADILSGTAAGSVIVPYNIGPGNQDTNQRILLKECLSESISGKTGVIPEKIAGMTLEELRDDYRDRIFNQYLPFWEKGGYDGDLGGFMCELDDDGKVVNDEKYIWYQGRGIWDYSFLYNNFGKERKYLEIAEKSRNFMVKNMYLGKGLWRESVDRQGNPVNSTVSQGSSSDIYGSLFSSAGLIEIYKATGSRNDLDIALDSIRSSVRAYESPDYGGITVPGIDQKGLRTIGHSFMFVWNLTSLFDFYRDKKLEELQNEHINHIINDFWNPEYGINNENLLHDYSRIPGYESVMYSGHYLETLWMVLHEALRRNDTNLFNTVKTRIRRLIEMTWDYVFEGMGTEDYFVFSTDGKCQGPDFDLKVMWAHTELLVATMMVLEHTGETWAKEWYERGREYCLRTMANTGNGIWRQAADRFGNDKQRPGISIYRKDNFHQVRYQMMNLLSIERMITNKNKASRI